MQTIKKHSTLFIILAIIAVVIASMLYVILQPQPATTPTVDSNETTQQPIDSTNTDESADANTPEPAQAAGVYEEYSEAAFNQAEGRRVIFFYAPWCPQCRALDESILENTVPDGVAIFKIDHDSNQAMRQKYGVTIQTTLVEVNASGNEVRKYVAYDQPTFDAVKAAMEL